MKRPVLVAAMALGLGVLLTSFTASPASALCNQICRAKCTLQWKQYFKSKAECIKVWSRRNGPSGKGCGAPGGPYQRCE